VVDGATQRVGAVHEETHGQVGCEVVLGWCGFENGRGG